MDKEISTVYHYETIINIVAEMIVDYLKTTACDIDKKDITVVTYDNKAGNQGEYRQPRQVA